MSAFNLNIEQSHFMSVQNAWLSASLGRSKKIPSLKKLLGKSHPKKKIKIQSIDEMLKTVQFINQQLGGKDLRKWQQPLK